MAEILDDTQQVVGKQIGPFKGWQWAVLVAAPIGIYIFLSNRDSEGAEGEPATPSPVGYPTNALYDAGSMAILGRLNELANSQPNTDPDGIPTDSNLALLAFNLERAAEYPEYAPNRLSMLSWASRLFDISTGNADYDESLIDTIIAFFEATGLPLNELLDIYTPTPNPDPDPDPAPTPDRTKYLIKEKTLQDMLSARDWTSSSVAKITAEFGRLNALVLAGSITDATSRFNSFVTSGLANGSLKTRGSSNPPSNNPPSNNPPANNPPSSNPTSGFGQTLLNAALGLENWTAFQRQNITSQFNAYKSMIDSGQISSQQAANDFNAWLQAMRVYS